MIRWTEYFISSGFYTLGAGWRLMIRNLIIGIAFVQSVDEFDFCDWSR